MSVLFVVLDVPEPLVEGMFVMFPISTSTSGGRG